MFLLPCYLGEEGGVAGIVDCCILVRELYVIIVIFSPSVHVNRLIEKHSPVAFLVLISLNISALVTRGLYAHIEGCQENAASFNLSSLILNIQYFSWQGMSDLYIFLGGLLYILRNLLRCST